MPFFATAPAIVNFVNTSTSEFTDFSWNFGDGNTSTDENPQNTYAAEGTYTVVLTASNELTSQQYSDTVVVGALSTGYSAPDQAYENCIGVDPVVILRISNDGGKTFGAELPRTIGRVGEYDHRTRWNRCGQGRRRVWEVVVTDPEPWRATGCYMKVSRDGKRFR